MVLVGFFGSATARYDLVPPWPQDASFIKFCQQYPYYRGSNHGKRRSQELSTLRTGDNRDNRTPAYIYDASESLPLVQFTVSAFFLVLINFFRRLLLEQSYSGTFLSNSLSRAGSSIILADCPSYAVVLPKSPASARSAATATAPVHRLCSIPLCGRTVAATKPDILADTRMISSYQAWSPSRLQIEQQFSILAGIR